MVRRQKTNKFFKTNFNFRRQILCYPNGETRDSISHISIFLNVIEEGSSEWKVNFMLSLKSQISSEKLQPICEVTKDANEIDTGFGWAKFLSHDDFFDPSKGYYMDGKFTIFSEV
jgi:hypothetical protein